MAADFAFMRTLISGRVTNAKIYNLSVNNANFEDKYWPEYVICPTNRVLLGAGPGILLFRQEFVIILANHLIPANFWPCIRPHTILLP